MLQLKSFYFFVFLLLMGNVVIAAAPAATDPIQGLVGRIVPAYQDHLLFVKIPSDGNADVFELETINGNTVVRGNNYNSMAVGLNYYLKYYCHTYVSWYSDDSVNLPVVMPAVNQKIRKLARVKNRFFLNYCTFSYTMPWWKWEEWERCIDWMALNGITMPLSITGQEAIWYKVWKKLGLSDQQIRSYFTGPAYLPFHRMGIIDRWDGPLPWSWINNQVDLQKKIISRERELGMTPILPAFSGHVPQSIITKFPNAKIKDLGEWGGFDIHYRGYFLDPMDPLFNKIQKEFLLEQAKEFGTDHVYGADPFNELIPPSWEPDYLAKVSKTIYQSMREADPEAVWFQMSWLFYIDRKDWTNPRIEAFVKAVPENKMILLDYFCENTEVWKLTDKFYNQPYIWCYLGNFGGNTMLGGDLKEVEKRIENTFVNGGENLLGVGSTLEALDVNPLMHEYVFEKVWSDGPTDVDQWVKNWADQRTGKVDENARTGWELLLRSAYSAPTHLGQATLTNSRPSFTGRGKWTNPEIKYQNVDLLEAWGKLLLCADPAKNSSLYDLVNIGRQVLGNYFSVLRDEFATSYKKSDLAAVESNGQRMLTLMDEINTLLATQSSFLLGKWLQGAKDFGTNEEEKKYYEHDARNIITVWSTKDQSLNDYANRSWAGLTETYYKQRWKMFIDEAVSSIKEKRAFNEKGFHEKVTSFEVEWTYRNEKYTDKPSGDAVGIGKSLYKKYAPFINKSLNTK